MQDDPRSEDGRLYRRVYECTSEPMLLFNVDTGAIMQANPAACDLYGYTLEEICTLMLDDLCRTPDGAAEASGAAKPTASPPGGLADGAVSGANELMDTAAGADIVMPSNAEVDLESIVPLMQMHSTKSGELVPVDVSVGQFAIDDREYGVITIRDLSMLREAQAERAALEAQFHQAQKLEAVGRLAGGVAHDFNNLLVVITQNAQFLKEGIEDEERLQDVEEILDASKRAAALTRQLLTFARRDKGANDACDVNEVVTSMERMMHRLLGEDIQIQTDLSSGPTLAQIDGDQLGQIVLNLAINARDAMPNGGTLSIKVEKGRNTDPVAIRVSDTGCGMPPEVLSRIFEPFYTTKGVGVGTGLGLSTAWGILQRCGGDITATSEPDKGTTFRIEIPRYEDTLPKSRPRKQDGAKVAGTVLLVEDEAQVRRAVARLLRRRGYQVLEGADGRDALEVAESYPGTIDVLLTDVVMPHVSGEELATALLEVRPDVNVLYMSGYSDRLAAHMDGSGVDDVIPKPFEDVDLLARVQQAVGGGLDAMG